MAFPGTSSTNGGLFQKSMDKQEGKLQEMGFHVMLTQAECGNQFLMGLTAKFQGFHEFP